MNTWSTCFIMCLKSVLNDTGRSGFPFAGESLDLRLNRFAEKRMVQSTGRRFLEVLLLDKFLLGDNSGVGKDKFCAVNS